MHAGVLRPRGGKQRAHVLRSRQVATADSPR